MPILNPEAPVLVIGAAGVDMVGRLRAVLQDGTSNPAHIRLSYGGVARNVAENLARLGHPVQLITSLGQDVTGRGLLQQITAAGVDTSAVLQSSEFNTGSYLAVLSPVGEFRFALDDMRALTGLTPAYLRERYELFKNASLLFLDANLPPATLRTAMSLARRARVPVIADPTSLSLARRFQQYLDRLLLITPNRSEASVYCDPGEGHEPQASMDMAKCLVTKGVDIAIITLAELGVCYATSETSGYVPAIRTEVADPTGAGDAMTAAVIFALLNEIQIDDAVRLGVSAASLTLRHRGAVHPDLSLEKLYDQLVI